MTTKPTAPPLVAPVARFPEMPPREDMQNFVYLVLPGHPEAIRLFLGNPERTLVMGDAAVGWSVHQQAGKLYPDLMVSFEVDPGEVMHHRGYGINHHGKPPDFVLEVASYRTAYNDYGHKRQRYAQFGIPEYWRFDNTGGQLYPAPLAGDRLAGDVYQPIPVFQTAPDMYWGRSDVLKLDLCWERGVLRWYDPATGTYLLTHYEEREGRLAEREARMAAEEARIAAEEARIAEQEARIAAESQRDAAKSQRDAERVARISAEAQRDAAQEARIAEQEARIAEREARIAEQEARIAAEARIRRLEEELRRRPPDSAP